MGRYWLGPVQDELAGDSRNDDLTASQEVVIVLQASIAQQVVGQFDGGVLAVGDCSRPCPPPS